MKEDNEIVVGDKNIKKEDNYTKIKEAFEYNPGEINFLQKKTFRSTNEFPVLQKRPYGTKINFRDEDNKDNFLTDIAYNRLKYDILHMPDYVPSFKKEDLELNFFKYNYKENIRSFKPLIMNEGKKMTFTVQSDVFIDNNFFVLNLLITNPNPNNWLQYDQSPIKNMTITNNSQLVEEIFDYAIIENIENDFVFASNYYDDNKLAGPLTMGTKNILIPPIRQGTNTIFNPFQSYFDYMSCREINDGKLSFKTKNTRLLQVKVNSHVLGRHHTKKQHGFPSLDDNLTPLFLYSCLQVNIELNEFAFFVPIFNARIQDLTNVSINDNEYEFTRLMIDQNTEVNKLISNLTLKKKHFVKTPRTNTTKQNSVFTKVCNDIDSRCLYESMSVFLYKLPTHAKDIKKEVLEFMNLNQKICQDILAFTFRLNYDEFDLQYYDLDDNKQMNYGVMDKVRENVQFFNKTTSTFKFTKKLLFDKYKKELESNKLVINKNDLNAGTLVDLFAISTLKEIPIELYAIKRSNNSIESTKTHTLERLEFITLINGHFNTQVCRIGYDEGSQYGLISDLIYKNYEETKFITVTDIFRMNPENNLNYIENTFLDLINPEFFKVVGDISILNNHDPADYLYSIDFPQKLFNSFEFDRAEIRDAIINEDYNQFSRFFDLNAIFNDPFYNGYLLENAYIHPFLNFYFNAKTNELRDMNELSRLLEIKNSSTAIFKNDLIKFCSLDTASDIAILNYIGESKNYIEMTSKAKFLKINPLYVKFANFSVFNAKNEVKPLDMFSQKNEIMNSAFIEKLTNSYGSDNAFSILSNLMPDLFNYKLYTKEIQRALSMAEKTASFDYSQLWVYLSSSFLRKFKTQADIVSYISPFDKFDNKFQKYRIKNIPIQHKMSSLETYFKNISFDILLHKENVLLPVVGYLIKLQRYIQKYPQNIKNQINVCTTSTFYLDQLKQLIMTAMTIEETSIDTNQDEETQRYDPEAYVKVRNSQVYNLIQKNVINNMIGVTAIAAYTNATVLTSTVTAFGKVALTGTVLAIESIDNLMRGVENLAPVVASSASTAFNSTMLAMNSLGPLTWCGLALMGGYAMYKFYNAYNTKNTYENINEIEEGNDMKLIEEELIKNLMSASQLFYFENDYNTYFNNYESVPETNDVKLIANKHLEFTKVLLEKETNYEEIINNIKTSLENYTQDKLQEISDRKLILETELKTLETNIKSIDNDLWKYDSTSTMLYSKESNYFSLDKLTQEGMIKDKEKDFIIELKKIGELLEKRSKTVQEISTTKVEILKYESILKIEIQSIKSTNEYLKTLGFKYNVFYKFSLNTLSNNDFNKKVILISADLKQMQKTKNSIYQYFLDLSKYVSNPKTKLKKYEIDNYMKQAEKILTYHFKMENPQFLNYFTENNFIFSWRNMNREESNNTIFTCNNTVYELVSDKNKLTDSMYKKRNLNKTDDKKTDLIVRKNIEKEKTEITFRKFNQKTELTDEEILNIKSFYAKEVEYKNLPYLFANTDAFIEVLTGLNKFDLDSENSILESLLTKIKNIFAESEFTKINKEFFEIKELILKELDQKKNAQTKLNFDPANSIKNDRVKLSDNLNKLFKYFFNSDFHQIGIKYINALPQEKSKDIVVFKQILLILKTHSTIQISDKLINNVIVVLANIEKLPMNLDTQLDVFLRFYFTELLMQLDRNILAKAIVENLKIGEKKEIFDFYTDEIDMESFSIKNGAVSSDNLLAPILEFVQENGVIGKKYFNKPKLPNHDEIYRVSYYLPNLDFDSFEIILLDQVPKKNLDPKITINTFIDKPKLEGGISETNQSNPYLKKEEKQENAKLFFNYFVNVKERMNVIFKYFVKEYKEKTIYSTTIIEIIRKISTKLSRSNTLLSYITLVHVSEVFISIMLSIMADGTISRADVARVLELPVKIDYFINAYNLNKKEKLKTVEDVLDELEDPEMFARILNDIQKEIPKRLEPKYKNQNDFIENNKEINLSSQINLSRHYAAESEFLIKEITFTGHEDLRSQILQNRNQYSISSSKLKINSRFTFKDSIPNDLILSFYRPFKNLYFAIYYKNEDYPTFRKSTRFNRGIKIMGCEINGVRFPPYMMSGKSNNSNLNNEFLEQLGYAINLKNTSINKYNFAVDKSSTYYISKKIYGKNDSIFEFEDKNNAYFDFVFGYHNEILGKSIFGISYDQIYFMLNNKIPLDQMNIKLIFDNDNDEYLDPEDQFELVILEDTDFVYKLDSY